MNERARCSSCPATANARDTMNESHQRGCRRQPARVPPAALSGIYGPRTPRGTERAG